MHHCCLQILFSFHALCRNMPRSHNTTERVSREDAALTLDSTTRSLSYILKIKITFPHFVQAEN